MSGMFNSPKVVALVIIFALVGAASGLLLFWGCGWWGDGGILFFFGMMLGQWIGFGVMAYSPRWQESDAPFMVGGQVCALVMVALWLSLPEGIVTGMGHVARALLGGMCGMLLAYGLAAQGYDYNKPDDVGGETEERGDATELSRD